MCFKNDPDIVVPKPKLNMSMYLDDNILFKKYIC